MPPGLSLSLAERSTARRRIERAIQTLSRADLERHALLTAHLLEQRTAALAQYRAANRSLAQRLEQAEAECTDLQPVIAVHGERFT